MTTVEAKEQGVKKQMEKQMGCMAGFLQIFDRQQLLSGKRSFAKGLPASAVEVVDAASSSEKTDGSPAISGKLGKRQLVTLVSSPSPDHLKPSSPPEVRSPTSSVIEMPPTSPIPLPILELKEGTRSSLNFCKEAPRLSLDSRAAVDAKGSLHPGEFRTNDAMLSASRFDNGGERASAGGADKQRRSPSVIARLMGLEQLPHSSPQPLRKAELRRSASESRISRDFFQRRSTEGSSQTNESHAVGINITSNIMSDHPVMKYTNNLAKPSDPIENAARNPVCEIPKVSNRGGTISPCKSAHQRKYFFDSADIFPEPKQTVSVYGEIEKRLKMRGIDEPCKDLETLKRILEALQLKGLLHSKKAGEQIRNNNFGYDDRSYSFEESPIVVMKPSRSPASSINRRIGCESPPSNLRSKAGVRQNLNLAREALPTASVRLNRPGTDRNAMSPTRGINLTSTSETQRKENVATARRKQSPFHSPRLNSKRFGTDQTATTTRSPRIKPLTTYNFSKEKIIGIVTEDESSSISESTVASTCSQTDSERSKTDEHREGRNLLERCDKLLHSIAEITAANNNMQRSPVSVLDSSFDKDDSSSPSPIKKRSIHFKDQSAVELEDDICSPATSSSVQSNSEYSTKNNNNNNNNNNGDDDDDDDKSEDSDFIYISEILRASNYLPEDADTFLLLEKQQSFKENDNFEVSGLHRKIIFDAVTEILDRNRQLPPWKVYSWTSSNVAKPLLLKIWSEFRRFRGHESTDDLVGIISAVLKKDLAGDTLTGWGDCPTEMSDAVLDIERLVFKDLVGETIRDLAALIRKSNGKPPPLSPSCRKLLF